jgi:hypothetical protein
MPAKYQKIKEAMLKQGKSLQASKTSAARIFNSQRKPGQAPVTRSSP